MIYKSRPPTDLETLFDQRLIKLIKRDPYKGIKEGQEI